MIQFNLLPDVKLEYIKAQRTKRTVLMIATISASVAFAIFLILFLTVNIFQKQHIKNLSKDIAEKSNTLQNTPNLDKILTVQNQLKSLPDLHNQKPAASRVLGYLSQVTPTKDAISSAKVDFTGTTITISGQADSLESVNKYVDTLKFTQYKTADSTETKKAFSDVVLTSFSKNKDGTSFQIDFKYDAVIFDNAKAVTLVVPNTVSTRSSTEKPTDLFQQPNTQTPKQ